MLSYFYALCFIVSVELYQNISMDLVLMVGFEYAIDRHRLYQ